MRQINVQAPKDLPVGPAAISMSLGQHLGKAASADIEIVDG
jgi:hypothetical protein